MTRFLTLFALALMAANTYAARADLEYAAAYQAEKLEALTNCANGPDGDTAVYADLAAFNAGINNGLIRFHCLPAGSFEGNTVTITADGTSSARKWIIHETCPDSNAWDQDPSEQVLLDDLKFDNAEYWAVSCLRIADPNDNTAGASRFTMVDVDESLHIWFFDNLIEDSQWHLIRGYEGSDRVRIQHNVIRETRLQGDEAACILFRQESGSDAADHIRIVDNEIGDCHGDGVQFNTGAGTSPTTTFEDVALEGNSFYSSPTYRTNCSTGNLDPAGNCSCTENFLDIKLGVLGDTPTATDIFRVNNNVVSGLRSVPANQNACPDLKNVLAPAFDTHDVPDHDEADYIIYKGNIVIDSESGFWISLGAPDHLSFNNNVCYEVANTGSGEADSACFAFGTNGSQIEGAFNAVYKSGEWGDFRGSSAGDTIDFRNTAVLFSVEGDVGTPDATSTISGNAIMRSSTGSYDGGTGALFDITGVNPWQPSVPYSADATAANADYITHDGWILRATASGTTGSTEPTFNLSIDANTTDGSVVWTAVRGPAYIRKKHLTEPNVWTKLDYAGQDYESTLSPFYNLPGDDGAGCADDRGADSDIPTGATCAGKSDAVDGAFDGLVATGGFGQSIFFDMLPTTGADAFFLRRRR